MSAGQPVHETSPNGTPDESPVDGAPIHEKLAERLIREAMESGQFDDLPGTGEPIPGVGTTDDDLWWVRSWVQRNRYAGPSDSNKRS